MANAIMRAFGISAKKPNVAGFQVQTSIYDLPIPIVYGWARISGNLIHMPKQPVPIKGGGKGSGKQAGKSGGQSYVGPIALGLCEGPIAGIGWVWKDKEQKVDFATYYATHGWSLFLGTTSQTAWPYLLSNYASQAVPYQSTAYVANSGVEFPNGQMSQFSWEVAGFLPWGGGILDANPANIVEDYLTNAQYGANFPSALLGSMTLMEDYCAAAGLFCSPAFSSQNPAREQLNDMMEIANTAPVWSDGILKFIPYGDTPLTGNGRTYTPNTTPLYNLGDNDFLPNSGGALASSGGFEMANGDLDPVVAHRVEQAVAYNQVNVTYDDRQFDYNTTPYKAGNLASVTAYGPLPMTTLSLPAIKSSIVAQQVAQLRLQREQYVRNTYSFNLGWKYSLLEPMDLVTLTDAGLGLDHATVRITSVVEMADEQGFEFTAEEWPFGIATAALYSTGSADGTSPDTAIDPGNTTAPLIFQAATQIARSPLDILIAASGGAAWGGCDIWLSTDNVTFNKVGSIVGDAAYGVTTASLATNAAWPTVDSTHTLAVDISGSGRTLDSYSATDFAALQSLCYVGGELVAYETATLTGSGLYNLTTLYRGLYGSTIPASHAGGSAFALIDDAIGRISFPQGKAGQTIYFKFPAFNIYGSAVQDIATLTSVPYTIEADPVPFQNAVAQGTVAIDTNGSWSVTADGPSSALSYKYLTSTSAYPSDASVIAGGTIVSGRTFSVVAGGTLTFGQTIYITAVPYNAAGGNGNTLPSIHLRGSYQTFTASKTVNYSAGSTRPLLSGLGYQVVNGAFYFTAVGNPTGQINLASTIVPIPDGVTVTSVAMDLYSGTSVLAPTLGLKGYVHYYFYRQGSGTQTLLASDGTSNGLGWQTFTASISEGTTGRTYILEPELGPAVSGTDLDFSVAASGNLAITYTMPAPNKTI